MNRSPSPTHPPLLTRLPSVLGSITIALAAQCLGTSAFGQAFYAQRFNDSTGLELKNGAKLGPTGSGVSGKAEDLAYIAEAPTMTVGTAGPMAAVTQGPDAMTAEEFTMTLWYKARAPMQDPATLFQGFAGQLMWNGPRKQWHIRLYAQAADAEHKNAGWLFSGKLPGTASVGEWTFLAIVWKQEGNYSEYWFGNTPQTATLARKGTSNFLTGPLNERAPLKRAIGNDVGKNDRPFDGSIDDVRFFKKALGADEIKKIQKADLANEEVKF